MLRRLGPVLAVLLLVLATAASASARRSVPRGWLGRSASALSSLCAQHARRYFDAVALHPYKKRASDLVVLRALARERRRLGVGGVYWYDWVSMDASREEPFAYAGLRSLSGGRVRGKSSLAAYAREALRLEGRR